MAWGAAARAAGRGLADLLWPPVCAACGAETDAPDGLCARCFAEAAFISGPVCDRCGLPLPGAGPGECCEACRRAPPGWDRARAAALYEGPTRRATLALKHGDRLDVAGAAAGWLLRAGAGLLAQADLVAPAPLHWTRLLSRRFNQSAELMRPLLRRAGRREAAAYDLLTRVRRTPSQEGRSRAERQANMAGAFRVTPRWRARVRGARVLLIDDVLTTGATLSACAETLKAAGAARVDALVIARVARDD
jgi:predicted amidophosphoribosyltransferase